ADRLHHAQGSPARIRRLRQPHSQRHDRRERPVAVGRVGQPAQGRGAQRRADRPAAPRTRRARARTRVTIQESQGSRAALIAGLSCHVIWGFAPLLFQAIGHYGAGAWEIMAHRIVWGALSTALLVWLSRQSRDVLAALTTPKLLLPLALSAFFIANNWTLYI